MGFPLVVKMRKVSRVYVFFFFLIHVTANDNEIQDQTKECFIVWMIIYVDALFNVIFHFVANNKVI